MKTKEQIIKEYKKSNKELQEIIDFKRLKGWLLENVGTKCKSYCVGCYCCDAWHGYVILKSLIGKDWK